MNGRFLSTAVGLLLLAATGLSGGCYRSWFREDPLAEDRQRMVYPSDPPSQGAFLAVRPDGVIAEQLWDRPPDRIVQPAPPGAEPPLTVQARPVVPPRSSPGEVIGAPSADSPDRTAPPPTTQPH